MEKYGIVVSVTEEFLKIFLSPHTTCRMDVLAAMVKDIVMINWGVPYIDRPGIECHGQYDIKTDKYLFRLRSPVPVKGFCRIMEGGEYPQRGWFLEK